VSQPTSQQWTAGLFLLGKQILYRSFDRTGFTKELESNGSPMWTKPMVVIVNGATASAAEILAGALQDNHRAMLVGTQTFGQGLIHSAQPLLDGSGVVFAVARFTTPNGTDVRHRGLTPDCVVSADEMSDPRGDTRAPNRQYRKAVNVLLAEIARSEALMK
jgi:carboxyl-terminal processing protease